MKGIWKWLSEHISVEVDHKIQEFGAGINFTLYGVALTIAVSSFLIHLRYDWKESPE